MTLILTALRYTLLLLVLAGIVYPLTMTALGQALFPKQANGSLIRDARGQVIGSELLGQTFTRPEYFHPRPSANNYDAANSGGSNLGPTSKKLMDRVDADVAAYRKENPTFKDPVPVDAVTASASGLDPDISLSNAYVQAVRVAEARGMAVTIVRRLIREQASQGASALGLAEPCVNVLQLNRTLDRQQKRTAKS